MRKTRNSHALAVAASLLLPALVPSPAAAFQNAPACPGPAFVPVTQIESQDHKLQAVIKVVNGNRNVPTKAGSPPQSLMLRYFEGYNPNDPKQRWPADPSAPGPGPTLRAEIGDIVQITLLNQVKVQDFAGSLDSGEEGRGNGCDQATAVNADGTTDKNWYPANDKYPNCFHGSSSANLHFHGTHVTPSTTGDNVLVNVRPNPKVTEKEVQGWFGEIFQHCDLGHEPKKWEDLPQGWRDFQDDLLAEYDKTAPYVGPGRNPSGHGLPPNLQLLPQNKLAIANGIWPQWYIGSYPNCFQLPKYTVTDGKPNVQMGQAPGTHWYHSHKHGSTSLNLFNGLAGAFIITDDSPTGYDGKLQAFYGGKLEERVLVLQQITTALNLLSAARGGAPPVLVNGQLTPTFTMRPGEVQLWRMINATVQSTVKPNFKSATLQFRQTAQDGVQLAPENYGNAQNGTQTISMAPANRVDVLVQAPSTPGCLTLNSGSSTILAYVNVVGDPVSPAMGFPAQADFPQMPPFLNDIQADKVRLRREITYSARKDPDPPTGRVLTQFTIDGKQFEDQVIDQLMLLGATEEWTLLNSDTTTGIAHPFHIHINPFQIFELFNPNTMTEPQKLTPPFVWWDTFAIPPGKVVDGKVVPGYFKMRTRFVDFTGKYVQHCHILAHEDRGMMQLLEVADNKTVLKHH